MKRNPLLPACMGGAAERENGGREIFATYVGGVASGGNFLQLRGYLA